MSIPGTHGSFQLVITLCYRISQVEDFSIRSLYCNCLLKKFKMYFLLIFDFMKINYLFT